MSRLAIVGATGFVGTALTLKLLDQGHQVVALSRHPERWPLQHKSLRVIKGDLMNPADLVELFSEADAAYYLVHGLASDERNFEFEEARAAANFSAAAKKAKLPRLVFLGALGPSENSSVHLRSRQLVGDILSLSGATYLEFRASIVLGANSTSFEMIKAITQRLPVRPYAAWLETPCQPIAQADLLAYLLAALDVAVTGRRVVEIGAPQVVPYGELLDLYARNEKLTRPKFLLPMTDQRLLLPVLELIVPEYHEVAKKLFLSLECPTVVTDRSAEELFPEIRPMDVDKAMALAFEASETDYPAVWEGDFWKELKDHTLLQTRQGQQLLLDKLKEMTEGGLPKTAVEMLKDKIRRNLPRRKGKERE